MSNSIYTIGHSNHEMDAFVQLLQRHSIAAIADVRSSPFSRIFPHFNREPLRAFIRQADIQYVFMGDCLGGRPDDPSCFKSGQVQYDRVALLPTFAQGLDRLEQGAEDYRIALMCSEKDPITCHRMLLVSRHLAKRRIDVQHILSDGNLESQDAAETRMMAVTGVPQQDLFEGYEVLLDRAYTLQSQACAFALREAEMGATTERLAI
jgi:uncharacterized protein (DUF488 family)